MPRSLNPTNNPYDYTNTTPTHDFPPFVPEDKKPKCGNDGTTSQRPGCEFNKAGICIHCGEEIPF